MSWITSVLKEIWSLFVDDGKLAFAVLIWLAAAVVTVRIIGIRSPWAGPLLFLGLAIILLESVWRRSRSR